MALQSLTKYHFVENFSLIITTSLETTTTINPIMHVRDVNPIRIVAITKFPNKLIKRKVVEYIAEDLTVCATSENVCVQIKCSPFHVLTTKRAADSTVEISPPIA